MSDPLRDVERAIERLGRRLVTGGEDLPEEVSVPAADLEALLAEVARLRRLQTGLTGLFERWDSISSRGPSASPVAKAALAMADELRGLLAATVGAADETQEAPGRREGEPGAEEG